MSQLKIAFIWVSLIKSIFLQMLNTIGHILETVLAQLAQRSPLMHQALKVSKNVILLV